MGTLGIFKDLLLKSFTPGYLLYMVLTLVLQTAAAFAIFIPIIIICLILFIIGAFIFGIFQLNPIGIFFYLLLGLIALILIFAGSGALAAVAFGLELNFARQFLSSQPLNLDTAFGNIKKNFMSATKLFSVVYLVMLIAMAVIFAISFVAANAFIRPQGNYDSILALGVGVIIFLFLLALASLFLSPFFTLLYQFPFFAAKGVKSSIANAIEFGKKSYWQLFKLMFVSTIFFYAIYTIFLIAIFFASSSGFSSIGNLQNVEGLAKFSSSLQTFEGLLNLFSIIIGIWAMSLFSLVFVKSYMIAVPEMPPKLLKISPARPISGAAKPKPRKPVARRKPAR